jgi:predicted transcriptional regulator
MKTIIKTSALFLGLTLLSAGVFAADKTTEAPKAAAPAKQNLVLFTSLAKEHGVQVIVHKATPANSSVRIYDAAGNLLVNDALSKKEAVSLKGYDLSQLEDGDYTIQVTANKEVTNRIVHVYNDENNQRSFFFKM